MEENTKQNISFWKRILISIKDFEKYKIFAIENLSKSFKYFFQFAAIFVLIIAMSFSIKYGMIINKTVNYIKQDLPEFTYENGQLLFNEETPIELQSNDDTKDISYKIIIDTKTESEEEINNYKEKVGLYNYGILFLKDKVIFRSSLIEEDIEKTYSEIVNNYEMPESFNKDYLVNNLGDKTLFLVYAEIFIVMYIYLFISYAISILLDALILALLGLITAKIVKVKIKYSACYAMSIHALTLPIILNVIYIVINTFTGFYIKYFDIMYTTISYICMVAAILSIRSDLIKEQIVIGKIKDVQNKVKEETEEEENKEDKNEENKQNDDKQNEDEEGKIKLDDKNKDNNVPEEPAKGET